MQKQRTIRNGLAESLESFARRAGYDVSAVRFAWRACGLALLGLDPGGVALGDGPRIAPGVPCPTRNGLCDFDDEPGVPVAEIPRVSPESRTTRRAFRVTLGDLVRPGAV